jgi:hypothetical protein
MLSLISKPSKSKAVAVKLGLEKLKTERKPMENNKEEKTVKKGWFGKLFEKLDKKMEAKSREGGCCCSPKDPKKGSSCC